MKHKLLLATATVVGVLAVGSTVAWAATRGSSFGPGARAHMQQMGPGDMRATMARVHPGLAPATLDGLVQQCTKAMEDGMSSMHGSGGMGGMMGGSSSGGMMGGSGSAGMMGSGMGGGMMGAGS